RWQAPLSRMPHFTNEATNRQSNSRPIQAPRRQLQPLTPRPSNSHTASKPPFPPRLTPHQRSTSPTTTTANSAPQRQPHRQQAPLSPTPHTSPTRHRADTQTPGRAPPRPQPRNPKPHRRYARFTPQQAEDSFTFPVSSLSNACFAPKHCRQAPL